MSILSVVTGLLQSYCTHCVSVRGVETRRLGHDREVDGSVLGPKGRGQRRRGGDNGGAAEACEKTAPTKAGTAVEFVVGILVLVGQIVGQSIDEGIILVACEIF